MEDAVPFLAVDTPKLSRTIVLASKTYGINSICVGPGQTLTCSGKSFTLKVWFYFIFLVLERAMKLQNVRKE